MTEPLRHVSEDSLILGWDFSTGSVKCRAYRIDGTVAHLSHFPTDLWTEGGVSELNLMQLEGQAIETLHDIAWNGWYYGGLEKMVAGGISATHHTAGRLIHGRRPGRRAICWNDQTLAKYHTLGLEKLGGQERVKELIGGPWAERYSLTHLLKDEETLSQEQWLMTSHFLSHGSLAALYLTDRYTVSISSAASTGMMDLRTNRWQPAMLDALANPFNRTRALSFLNIPIVDGTEPIGPVKALFSDPNLHPRNLLIFPTLDDQAAGLVGGGATDAGHLAIILGNSAVVNSSADFIPEKTNLDVMKLNWGPYLWMRCYSNGAQFLDKIVGDKPDWPSLEAEARKVPAGCDGTTVMPFLLSEPSLGIKTPKISWRPSQPDAIGVRVRAAFEAIAYLIALAVKEHEAAGQRITRISVSGGIAKSDLMLEILASTINKPLERLESDEGPALGAAVAALWGLECHRRKQAGDARPYAIADAVSAMVKFRTPVQPRKEWIETYARELLAFDAAVNGIARI